MRRILIPAVPALAASVVLAACGSSSSSSTSSSSAAPSQPAAAQGSGGAGGVVVKSAANATLGGAVLTNAQGMTLYALSGEGAGKFICTSSACTQVWHPLTISATAKPSGSVGALATVKRPDGSVQVTFRGEPLYTFAQDTKPGDALGQGVKDVGTWDAVKVSAASAPAPAASTPAAPASGGSYSY